MTSEEVRNLFNENLNRHGYAFHARVLAELRLLREQKESAFVLETIEFPTSVRGANTRVDFVLSRGLGNGIPDFLLAECKRANPAMANWCFARYPLTRRDNISAVEPVIVESVNWRSNSYSPKGVLRGFANNPVHIGIEVRTGVKGVSSGESGKAIEDASSQILRGLNGFVEAIEANRQICGVYEGAFFLPVIFTTAKLWVSAINLSLADLETGNIDLSSAEFTNVPWLCYQYHQSPGITHSLPRNGRSAAITKLMEEDYIRTIPIVNSEGIKEFVNWASNF